ncbi:MAG: hypothetical protein KF712_04615 [Akkermansiaceae bacterium]|nr:hypothetical protein [Akkermansiaceae bacterium]
MNDNPIQIRVLLDEGKSWPEIFRGILSGLHPENRTYVHLTSELMRSCRLKPDVMNHLQQWDYWFKKTGYDDGELAKAIEGKISPKD